MTAKTATPALARTTLSESDMKCRCSAVVTASGETTGCTRTTTRTFAPGHDAKLKSLLGAALANGEMVTVTTGGNAAEMSPLEAAGLMGNFGQMVVAVAEKIRAKRERAANHKAKLAANAAKRAEAAAAKKAAKAKETREPATAKVGRWERTGFLVTQKTGEKVFEFAKKDGEVQQVAKFQLV